MGRLVRLSIFFFVVCFLAAGNAFAATYYIAANGSDSNTSTQAQSKSTPWLHAPGMSGCALNCASYTPVAGDRFIFRGGDTWHNSASGLTPAGIPWTWTWSGTSGSYIYIGVDQTWYTGGSWTRPILNGDNPLSTTTVASCSYRVGTNNTMFTTAGHYIDFDNFEMVGLCQNAASPCCSRDIYIYEGGTTSASWPNTFENAYIHGWTHVAFDSPANCTANPSAFVCFAIAGIAGNGSSTSTIGPGLVVDGADSHAAGGGALIRGPAYIIYNSVFRYNAQIAMGGCHILHDTLFEFMVPPGDGATHGNAFECNSEWSPGPNLVYQNLVRHSTEPVNFWLYPAVGQTDYVFNNVMYDVSSGSNYFNLQRGTFYVFNNTFENPQNGAIIDCEQGSFVKSINNHFITNASSPYYAGTCATTTNLLQSHTTATNQGYISSETYAYSPASAGAGTVGTGTNVQSICTVLSGAGYANAATACQSDTTYACTYNTNSHTVTCPGRTPVARPASSAPSVGAYELGSVSTRPNPPTGLAALVQ